MVYLNDDFSGGATNFYNGDGTPNARVQPKHGMALVFRHAQLHEGAPVTSGRKYVLRTDVMYSAHPVVNRGAHEVKGKSKLEDPK